MKQKRSALRTMFSAIILGAANLLPGVLLSAALSLFGCGENSRTPAVTEQQPPRRRPAAVVAPPPPSVSKAICTLTNDTLAGQPFGAEPTVDELRRAGAEVVGRKPFSNLHVAGQTDTILTLRHQGNEFEFYRTSEKDLLRQAVITNFQPSYGQRLRATLTESARQNGGRCGQLRLRDTERANNVSATFRAGQPSLARVQPYLD